MGGGTSGVGDASFGAGAGAGLGEAGLRHHLGEARQEAHALSRRVAELTGEAQAAARRAAQAAKVEEQVKEVAAVMDTEPADGDFDWLRNAMGGIYTITNKSDALEYDLDTVKCVHRVLRTKELLGS